MKIAVVAAGGKAGRKIVAEANSRGIEVTAFVRKPSEVFGASKVVVKDIFALEKDDLKDFDAVVDAFGAWTPETFPLFTTTSQHLCDILSGTNTRLLIVGGEELIVNSAGESVISYADYAVAMIDEILSDKNIQKRIGVVKA